MADTKLEDFAAVTDVDDADDFYLVRAGEDKRITGEDLRAELSGGGGGDPIFELFGTPDTAFEFDTSSLAGLTAFGATPDAEDADTSVPSNYFVRDVGTTGPFWSGRAVASPAAPFTAITKITDDNVFLSANNAALLLASDAAVSGAFEVNSHEIGVTNRGIATTRWTDLSTFAEAGPGLGGLQDPPIWLAIVVNGNDDVDFLFSMNGWIWKALHLARNPSFTPGAVGIGISPQSSGGVSAAFDFLRIWDTAKSFPGVP